MSIQQNVNKVIGTAAAGITMAGKVSGSNFMTRGDKELAALQKAYNELQKGKQAKDTQVANMYIEDRRLNDEGGY